MQPIHQGGRPLRCKTAVRLRRTRREAISGEGEGVSADQPESRSKRATGPIYEKAGRPDQNPQRESKARPNRPTHIQDTD